MAKKDVIDEVIAIVKALKVNMDDYRPRKRGKATVYPIHDKVLKEIKQKLEPEVFRRKLGDYGVDYLKRASYSDGRIELAIEVDRWPRIDSWRKLADIRANDKVWIFVPDEERVRFFEDAIERIQDLLNSRREDETLGNFVTIMKTPDKFEVKEIIKVPKQAPEQKKQSSI